MKTLILSVVLAIGSSAYLIKIPNSQGNAILDRKPENWVIMQSNILSLFENVCEPSTDPTITTLAETFDSITSNEDYTDPEVLVNLKNLQTTKGLLPKGQIFSEFNEEHLNELKIIYDAMFHAKNFDAFYKVASWARQNINCGLFIDAIYLAILKRSDLKNILLPAPYEILPNYFIRKDVVLQVSSLMAGNEKIPSDDAQDEGNKYTIVTNYTNEFNEDDEDSKLAYFHEDVGLNTYYFLRKLLTIPWIRSETNLTSRYGEYMYYVRKTAAARCNLERYSNGLSEIEVLDWDSLKTSPYNPALVYSNGNDFTYRTKSVVLMKDESIEFLQNIENNLLTVVSQMRESGYDKTQIINHLSDILLNNEQNYETIALKVLGKNNGDIDGEGSVLTHYMTTLRDPMFWKLNKKIVDLIDQALKILPTYSKSELWFPGVEISNVEIKKMITNFEYFEFDVTDALKTDTNNVTFQVRIKQPRLNHKPFTIKLDILSQVTQKGLVKIYLGPKMLPGELYIKKNLFMLFDTFEINLKVGSNVITRTSDEIKTLSKDFIPLESLRLMTEYAQYGFDTLLPGNTESILGFPNRLLLPKGSSEGLPAQIFVFVAPLLKYGLDGINADMEINSAILSPGYPLDLNIENTQLFNLPNAMVKNIIITHKGDIKFGNYKDFADKDVSHEPSSLPDYYSRKEPFDPSSRPDYSQWKNTFDYNSKKGQYGKNEDYAAKKSWPFKNNDQDKQPEVIDSTPSNLVEDKAIKNVSEKDINDNLKNSEIGIKNIVPNKADNIISISTEDRKLTNSLKKRPLLRLVTPRKHVPTVFDYLMPTRYDANDMTDEVYE